MEESRLRFARLVAGRRSKFVAIGAWILLVAGLAPLAGKFEGAQKNEPSTFLPGNAESVEVLEAAQTFPSGDATIATIVFHDPSGLNAAERQSRQLRAGRWQLGTTADEKGGSCACRPGSLEPALSPNRAPY